MSKIIWFRNQVVSNADKKCFTVDEIHDLIAKYASRLSVIAAIILRNRRFSYLQRFDSDEQTCETLGDGSLKIDHSISIGVDITRMFVSQESNEYASSGLLVPDLSAKARVEQLRLFDWRINR